MSGRPISENPYLFPSTQPGFLQGFIGRQDEAAVLSISNGKITGICDSVTPRSIHQLQLADSNVYCTSLLSPHELNARGQDPKPVFVGSPDWLLGIFSLCVILLVIARVAFLRRFDQILNAFLRPRHLSILVREGNLMKDRITPPLLILQLFSYGLLIYLLASVIAASPAQRWLNPRLFFFILGGYALFYFLRMMTIQLLSRLFSTREVTHTYLINSLVMDEISGILLLPVSLALLVSGKEYASLVFFLSVGCLILFLLYRLIRNFMVGLSNAKFSRFYLFLYLCTVEILPILVVGKLINDWL